LVVPFQAMASSFDSVHQLSEPPFFISKAILDAIILHIVSVVSPLGEWEHIKRQATSFALLVVLWSKEIEGRLLACPGWMSWRHVPIVAP